jgi:hypothetical protein
MNEDIQKLIDITVALERQQCAHHYLALMRDAVEQARTKEREKCAGDYLQDCANAIEKARLEEREACAKLCDQLAKFFGEKGEYATHELHRREWETLVGCAAAIRGRTE